MTPPFDRAHVHEAIAETFAQGEGWLLAATGEADARERYTAFKGRLLPTVALALRAHALAAGALPEPRPGDEIAAGWLAALGFEALPPGPRRPERHTLVDEGTDPARTAETRAVIEGMVDALNAHRIDDIGAFFAEEFWWIGNAGCGTKPGLRAFQDNWQRPFQAAFGDKVAVEEGRLFMGEWAASFGRQEATHRGTFMGIPATGRRIEIRYMDFWRVRDGRIVDNWVMVDFPHVLAQLGRDVFDGEGWEAYDRGARTPPRP